MKAPIFFALMAVVSLLFFVRCSNDDVNLEPVVEYPDSGFNGANILNLHDTIYLCDLGPTYGDGEFNSMKAILPNSSSKVRVEISGIRVAVYNNQGWQTNATPYMYNNYIFETENSISADLKIYFCGEGNALVKIYENNDSIPVRIKNLVLSK